MAAPQYASSLIQSLRGQYAPIESNNPGINYLPNQASPRQSTPFTLRDFSSFAFNPQILSHKPGAIVTPEMRAEALRNHKGEEDPSLTFFSGGGDYSSDSSGSDSIGQGVNNDLADFGLSLMAYGENPFAPGAIAAGMLGYSIAGAQADAMGEAADALGDYDIAGVSIVSDENGNVYGISNDDSIAAADAAMFGIDPGGLMGSGFADAGLDAGYADSISGVESYGGGYDSGFGGYGDFGGYGNDYGYG